MSKVWAVSSNKGGVLKTNISINVSGILSKENKVLICDLDNQSNVALSFGLAADSLEASTYDVLVDGVDPSKAIVNVYKNIDILPSNDDMAFFELDVLSNREKYPKPFSLLKHAIEKIRDRYDYIIIDGPPNMGLVTGCILTATEKVIIPFQPETFSQRSLLKTLKAIDEFREKQNPNLSVLGVVATLVDQRTSLHSEVLQQCRKLCSEKEIKLFDSVIPRSVRFASAIAYDRLPATLADPKHPMVQCYFELLKEVREIEQEK